MIVNLLQTCGGCPECYDAYINDEYIGNLRLRHGYFCVNFYYKGDSDIIYEDNPKESDGIFTNGEREYYLNKAASHLYAEYERKFNPLGTEYEIIYSKP